MLGKLGPQIGLKTWEQLFTKTEGCLVAYVFRRNKKALLYPGFINAQTPPLLSSPRLSIIRV
jgi:hypothetical protein